MKMLTGLVFIHVMMLVYCDDIDIGYPGGFYRYGDKNNDNVIDGTHIDANMNMAWLTEWYLITKNVTTNKDLKITYEDFKNLINRGILLVVPF